MQQHVRIVPVGTVVYRLIDQEIRECTIKRVKVTFDSSGTDVSYDVNIHGYSSSVFYDADSLYRNFSKTREECIERFLSELGVKAKVTFEK